MQKFIFSIILTLLAASSYAQTRAIVSGRITQENTEEALMGVNVYLRGTTLGAVTNKDGAFEIKGVPHGEHTLIASCAGYSRSINPMEINQAAHESINLSMKESNEKLGQVVVTATGTAHHLKNAPIATEVITGLDMQKSNVNDLQSALTTLSPSVSFQPTIMGQYLSINGMTNGYVMILVDGNRVFGDMSGNIDMSRINMNNVERIEMVKGASSSLYGSDAVGAVINIITKTPNHGIDASTFRTISANGEFVTNEHLTIKAGRFTSTTTYSTKKTDGYKLSDVDEDGEYTDRMVVYPSSDQTVTQKLTYAVTPKLSVEATGSVYNKDLTYYRSSKYDYKYEDINYSLSAKYLLKGRNYISLNYYADDYQYHQVHEGYRADSLVLTKLQNYRAYEGTGFFELSKRHKLLVGFQALDNKLKTKSLPTAEDQDYGQEGNTEFSLWAQDEWTIFKNLDAVIGARMTSHHSFGTHITPKAALMYKLCDFRIRYNFAYGYKSPTLQELYYDYNSRGTLSTGSADLDPQSSVYNEFSVEYNKRYFSASAEVFSNNVTDMIYRKNVTETITPEEEADGITKKLVYANMGEARTHGANLNLNGHFNGFTIGAGYNYVDAKGREEENAEMVELEKISPHAATWRVGWDHTFGRYGLNATIDGRYEDEKFFVDGNSKSYHICNLNTTHRFSFGDAMGVDIGAGVRNLFNFVDDRPYGVNYATLDPGRRVYISLRINFKQ